MHIAKHISIHIHRLVIKGAPTHMILTISVTVVKGNNLLYKILKLIIRMSWKD